MISIRPPETFGRTQIAFDSSSESCQKLKIPHPPSCTLDAVMIFVTVITIPLQETR